MGRKASTKHQGSSEGETSGCEGGKEGFSVELLAGRKARRSLCGA